MKKSLIALAALALSNIAVADAYTRSYSHAVFVQEFCTNLGEYGQQVYQGHAHGRSKQALIDQVNALTDQANAADLQTKVFLSQGD